jgi:hypothetical protein
MILRFLAVMAGFPLLVSSWSPVAVAQLSQPRTEQSSPTFSDTELKAFAVIVVEVQRIADSYRPKVEAAQTVREKEKLEVAASDELARAVKQEGLTVERYKEILSQTMSNPEVAGRVKQHIKQTK